MVFHIVVIGLNPVDILSSLCLLAEIKLSSKPISNIGLISKTESASIHEYDMSNLLFGLLEVD